jgi:hypothetical protein
MFGASAATSDSVNDGATEFRRAVAAILHEEREEIPEPGHVSGVADGAAVVGVQGRNAFLSKLHRPDLAELELQSRIQPQY